MRIFKPFVLDYDILNFFGNIKFMANIQSAKKRIRSNERKRIINSRVRSRIRTTEKSFLKAIESGQIEEARQILSSYFSLADKSIGKKVLKKGTVDRKKRRFSLKLSQLSAAS